MDHDRRSPSRCQRMRYALHQSARHRQLCFTVFCGATAFGTQKRQNRPNRPFSIYTRGVWATGHLVALRHRLLCVRKRCGLCRRCSSDCGSSKHHSHGYFLLFDGDVDQQWPWMRRVGHVWLRSGRWRRILFRTQVKQCCAHTVHGPSVGTGPSLLQRNQPMDDRILA